MADPDSSEAHSDSAKRPAGARMQLGPDAVHEGENEPQIDCPQCGSTVSLVHIIEEGRCPGTLGPEDAEVEDEVEQPQYGECNAKLSLELVWEE